MLVLQCIKYSFWLVHTYFIRICLKLIIQLEKNRKLSEYKHIRTALSSLDTNNPNVLKKII